MATGFMAKQVPVKLILKIQSFLAVSLFKQGILRIRMHYFISVMYVLVVI